MKDILVIHHTDADGYAAAYAAWLAYGDRADYLPANYQDAPPSVVGRDEVYILDFSYPLEVMRTMREQVNHFVVIDHHKTAEEAVRLVGGIFDITLSGCELAWQYFHPDTPTPRVVSYVGDRDLWEFLLPFSREVNAYVAALDFKSFPTWQNIASLTMEELTSLGRAVYALQLKQVEGRCHDATVKKFHGYEVPVVNSTENTSLLGERLCELYPDAPFSVSYADRSNCRTYSLRSKNGFDVGALAKSLGGGGHCAAAGFTTNIPE